MKNAGIKQTGAASEIQAEARQIRKLGQQIAASKKEAFRFLAATKMYDGRGRLKPQFG
jgi:hypothetical protein